MEKESKILGKILTPIISIEIFSEKHGFWYGLDEILVDTGADITLIPKNVGETLVDNIALGRKASIKGITHSKLIVYIHTLKIKVTNKEFTTKIAIANSNEVPAALGRFGALDMFDAQFLKGRNLILE